MKLVLLCITLHSRYWAKRTSDLDEYGHHKFEYLSFSLEAIKIFQDVVMIQRRGLSRGRSFDEELLEMLDPGNTLHIRALNAKYPDDTTLLIGCECAPFTLALSNTPEAVG